MSVFISKKNKNKMMASPEKFVKPADLFKMRRGGKCKFEITSQSPMKCLNNLTDPSPTKNLPTLLKNPFQNKPVKRRLNLGGDNSPSKSPIKRLYSNSNHSSPRKSPTKRSMKLEMDEDANMEAPRFRRDCNSNNLSTPRKRSGLVNNKGPCYQTDWTLRTKVRVNFPAVCKNWSQNMATTHKRHSGTALDEDTPSKTNDKTISLEAIKNAAIVYQHPYLSWLPLFPRSDKLATTQKSNAVLSLSRHTEATKTMHRDWCDSLDDLINLSIEGKCPFFYLCTDVYNILFKLCDEKTIQAHISPVNFGLMSELRKMGINVKCEDDDIENSQSGFDDRFNNEFDESEDEEESDEEASQFLESLGVSQQDYPSLHSRHKNITEADSNSQSTKSVSQKPIATIEGIGDIKKLVTFLQTNRLYTISKVGEFACIPPTLLAPREFRLSTPRHPEVSIGRHISGAPPTPPKDNDIQDKKEDAASRSEPTSTSSTATTVGPRFVELRGTILPNLFRRLHKLLTVSDNADHTCSATQLDSSTPFKTIRFSSS